MPDAVKTNPPIKSSSVEAIRVATEAKNASQKAELEFLRPDLARKNQNRLEAAERAIEALRQRIELLEGEDGLPVSGYPEK